MPGPGVGDSTRVMSTPGVGDATRVMPAPPVGGMGYGGDRTQVAITVTCPVCQTPNPPAEQYCQDCGLLFGSTPQDVEPLPDLAQLPRLLDAAGGREFALNPGTNTVGREAADVLLVDPTVSRRHAVLTLESGQLVVEDQGSTNGSYVAGRRLAPGERATAFDGDAVRFGNVHLSLAIPGAAARPAGAVADVGIAAPAPAEDRGAPVGFLVMPDGTEHPLFEGVNGIGRRSSNQIAINDAFMSGKHAEIRCTGGVCEMVDVGSTNGSFFNGDRMAPNAPLALSDGTAFTMGKTPVAFRAAGSAAPAPDVEATRLGDFELPADTTVAISAPAEGEPGW